MIIRGIFGSGSQEGEGFIGEEIATQAVARWWWGRWGGGVQDGSAVTSALEESAAAFSEKQQIHSKLFSERVVMMNCGRC